jgi:hypothetical protein
MKREVNRRNSLDQSFKSSSLVSGLKDDLQILRHSRNKTVAQSHKKHHLRHPLIPQQSVFES